MNTNDRPTNPNRRHFIQGAGVLSGLAVCQFPLRKLLAKDPRDRDWTDGVESWVPTACNLCPSACGVLARIVDGRAVRLEGNPHHPVNRGALCPKGHALLQQTYHSRRLRSPLKIGDGATLTPQSWDDALSAVGEALTAATQAGGRGMLVGQVPPGATRFALERFAEAFGLTPALGDTDRGALAHAHLMTQGVGELLAYDLARTDYLISFSSGLLDSWWSPVTAHHAYAHLRRGRAGMRARIVEVGPRFSRTASRADEWVPVKPGTEPIFALGLAYVLIKEALHDGPFVDGFCTGFESDEGDDLQAGEGMRSLVLREFRPEVVSGKTGAPVEVILRVAKEFARANRAVAVPGRELTARHKGAQAAAAVHMLNALKGSFDRPGGVLMRRNMPGAGSGVPPLQGQSDEGAVGLGGGGTLHPAAVAATIDESVRAVVIVHPETLLSGPGGERLREALRGVPTVVALTTVAAAEPAQHLLPVTTALEEFGDTEATAAFGYPVVSVLRPAVDPEGARSVADVVAALASVASKDLGWESGEDLLRQRIRALYEGQQGTVFTDPFDTEQIRVLAERGWRLPVYGSADDFVAAVLEKGGWWDPAYTRGEWGRLFRGSSRRFHFPVKAARELTVEPEGPEGYPFTLMAFEPLAHSFGWGGQSEWLLETSTRVQGSLWHTWVAMNPDTARHAHLHDRDVVQVETEHGHFEATVRLDPGAMPEVLFAPTGLGRSMLRDAGEVRGSAVEAALGDRWDELTGDAVLGPFPARLVKLKSAGHTKEAH
jgi:anaerobic selenocysteine-containing dehydrogenase